MKVEKNKSEEEEPRDAENQKHGDSLEGKGEKVSFKFQVSFGTKSERIYRHFPTITLNRAWERSILLVKQFLSENEIEGVFLEEGCFYLWWENIT